MLVFPKNAEKNASIIEKGLPRSPYGLPLCLRKISWSASLLEENQLVRLFASGKLAGPPFCFRKISWSASLLEENQRRIKST